MTNDSETYSLPAFEDDTEVSRRLLVFVRSLGLGLPPLLSGLFQERFLSLEDSPPRRLANLGLVEGASSWGSTPDCNQAGRV